MERGREARKGKANGTGDDHDRTQRGDHDAVRVGGWWRFMMESTEAAANARKFKTHRAKCE